MEGDIPHQILKIERELMRLVDLVSKMEARVALSYQHNAALWYDRAGCQAPSSFVLTASPASPQNSGVSITFTATIVGTTYVPTGTVQFMDGASNLGSPVVLVGGVASFTTSSLSVATHTINAVYSGDGQYCAGTQSISYQINSAAVDPCGGTFTAGTYHINDPFITPSNGTIAINLSNKGEGVVCAVNLATPAYGSCPSNAGFTAFQWNTTCTGSFHTAPLKLTIGWCADNSTGCVTSGSTCSGPTCAAGSTLNSVQCSLTASSSSSLTFTIPINVGPYTSGQTITIS